MPCSGCGEGLESSRVIGGGQANKNSIPWQVSLAADGTFQCGGTIICSRFVMTAAHCVEAGRGSYLTPSAVTINAEEHSQSDGNDHTTHTVKKIHRHAKYQAGFIFVHTILCPKTKCSPFLKPTPTL